MFAILAAIVFAVVVFGGSIASLNLTALGLLFIALHLAVPLAVPFGRRR